MTKKKFPRKEIYVDSEGYVYGEDDLPLEGPSCRVHKYELVGSYDVSVDVKLTPVKKGKK